MIGANGEGGKMTVDPKATIKDSGNKPIALGYLMTDLEVVETP